MKKFWGPILVTFLLLALLEIGSRIILNRIYNRNFDASLIIDNKYLNSAGLKENATGMVWGKPFHTDSFGCRKCPVAYSAQKKKWLFIGDSVTEGVGVDDSLTFASLVAARVDSVNIMNYSLIGYSDADYLNVLKTLLKVDPSISKVTIFFCLNDVYGKSAVKTLPVMAKQSWVGKLNGLLQNRYATYKLLKLLVYQNSAAYFKYDNAFYKSDNPFFRDAMLSLAVCDSVCKVKGVSMQVIMLPYRTQLSNSANMNPQHMLKAFCDERHIPFGYPSYTAGLKAGALYLFADEIHFSAAGHKMIADYIVSH